MGRMVGSVALLALPPLTPAFFALYLACGLSDVLDGWLVRRANAASKLGATLDNVADTLFVIAILVVVIPGSFLPVGIAVWVAVIFIVKVAALMVGYVRFRAYAAIHTYANKAAGLAIFTLPLLFVAVTPFPAACIVCTLASFAAGEELVLNTTARTLDRDAKGLLFAR